MQFISKGPGIPDTLLRLHEEGRVVFFCGSGISKKAGLPDYKGLVKQIWKEVGNNTPSTEEKSFMKAKRYDAALGYLESKFDDVGMIRNASKMRQGLATVLSRRKNKEGPSNTHKALLTLATTQGERTQLHLVTTNFDRLFEEVRKVSHVHGKPYIAPLLPIPKSSDWDGIVYLHGLLPEEHDEQALKNLVVTSGDFGRAYLYERWAARFVSELFREFVVCFVGYSLADPVMRYLADAIDAETANGEHTNPIYLFVTNKEADAFKRSKCIHCIPYSEEDGHRLLHETLKEWAKSYSKGSNGKEAIIDANADIDPDTASDDEFVGRLLWALSYKNGVGAKRFAKHNPVPSLHWAKILMSERSSVPVIAEKKTTHLLRLSGFDDLRDVRQEWIWQWFLRHLAEPDAVWLVLSQREFLHPSFKRQLTQELTNRLVSKKNDTEPTDSKSSIKELTPDLYRLWQLILAGKVVCYGEQSSSAYFDLVPRLQAGELDYSVLNNLKQHMTPVIVLERSWSIDEGRPGPSDETPNPLSAFDWYLDLASGDGSGEEFMHEVRTALDGRLAGVFDCAEAAILDGLEALRYLNPESEDSFRVADDIPSIEEHWQNGKRFHDWQLVVELLRDAWLELADVDKSKAHSAFRRWISSAHLIFRRLALFAAQRSDIVEPHEWFELLTSNSGRLLWGLAEQREVMRLIATTGEKLSITDYDTLANTIAAGPPVDLFVLVEKSEAQRIADYDTWLRLKKIECHGRELPDKAQAKLKWLSDHYPQWRLHPNQQEEFSFWTSGTGDPDFEAETQHILVPENPETMARWLIDDRNNPKDPFNANDNWKQMCREKPETVLDGLDCAASKGIWNERRIREAMQVWCDDDLMKYGCDLAVRLRESCPDSNFREVAGSVAFWCKKTAKTEVVSDEWLAQTAKRIFSMAYENDTTEKRNSLVSDPVSDSISHPIGAMTEALLNRYFGKSIDKNEGIPTRYRELFSSICSDSRLEMRHGRVILASRTASLYYADGDWTRENLLPLFDWKRDFFETRAAWCGFLMMYRIVVPLMQEIKNDFFTTADHIKALGQSGKTYCTILTLMGLWHIPGLCRAAYKGTIAKFEVSELEHCAEALMDYQTRWFYSDEMDQDERRTPERLWNEDVRPFIRNYWRNDSLKLSDRICASFAKLVVGTGKEFPNAQKELRWILKSCNEDKAPCLFTMKGQTRCLQDFPEESLDFLLLISKKVNRMSRVLKECLHEIEKVRPDLANDERFIKLSAISFH